MIVSICPSSYYGQAKRWPVKNFNSLIKKLIKYVDKVQILGSEKDLSNSNKIMKNLEAEKKIVIKLCWQDFNKSSNYSYCIKQ